MKITTKGLGIRCVITIAFLVITLNVFGQASGQLLVNEVEFDPPSSINEGCQYVEIRGANVGGIVPANTWFITIDNSNANPGNIAFATNIGGTAVGANGTITILNSAAGTCPARVYGPGTTIVTVNLPLGLGFFSSRAFLLLTSTTALTSGQNIDQNQDGQFDFSVTVIDGFAFNLNSKEEFNYGGSPQIFAPTTPTTDVPDAIVRFPGNSIPLAAAAFYWAEVAETPDEAVQLSAPFSPNFPQGGIMTPGSNNLPAAPRIPVADFDGDGRTDLSTFRSSDGFWYSNRSTTGFSAVRWGLSGDRPVPGDYDGDNKADFAIWRPSDTPTNADFYILNSIAFTFSAYSLGSVGDIPVTGDFDGDNKNDVVVWRPSSGTWYLWESTTQAIRTALFGLAGDVPFAMDNDGDGKSNLTVYRSADRIWYVANPTGVPAQNFNATVWGFGTDIKVPADYDGDGKDDIAIFRPANGTWYIRRSSDNVVTYTPFGSAGDIPVPGDYDGDAKDDIAVFRNASGNGTWYLNRTTAGLSIQIFGFGDDKPIPAFYHP